MNHSLSPSKDRFAGNRFPPSSLLKKIFSAGKIHFCIVTVLVVTGFLFTMPGCSSQASPKPLTEEQLQAEKDAILATVTNETASFFARDYEAWKSNFVQEDYAFQAWSNRDGTFDASVGWEAIDKAVGGYIRDNPEPEAGHRIVERKNLKYKFLGPDAALVTWDQFNSNRDSTSFTHSKEVRVMEKIDGKWKIACVSAFWDYQHLIPGSRLKDIQRMDKESRGKDKI